MELQFEINNLSITSKGYGISDKGEETELPVKSNISIYWESDDNRTYIDPDTKLEVTGRVIVQDLKVTSTVIKDSKGNLIEPMKSEFSSIEGKQYDNLDPDTGEIIESIFLHDNFSYALQLAENTVEDLVEGTIDITYNLLYLTWDPSTLRYVTHEFLDKGKSISLKYTQNPKLIEAPEADASAAGEVPTEITVEEDGKLKIDNLLLAILVGTLGLSDIIPALQLNVQVATDNMNDLQQQVDDMSAEIADLSTSLNSVLETISEAQKILSDPDTTDEDRAIWTKKLKSAEKEKNSLEKKKEKLDKKADELKIKFDESVKTQAQAMKDSTDLIMNQVKTVMDGSGNLGLEIKNHIRNITEQSKVLATALPGLIGNVATSVIEPMAAVTASAVGPCITATNPAQIMGTVLRVKQQIATLAGPISSIEQSISFLKLESIAKDFPDVSDVCNAIVTPIKTLSSIINGK